MVKVKAALHQPRSKINLHWLHVYLKIDFQKSFHCFLGLSCAELSSFIFVSFYPLVNLDAV